MPQLVKQIDYLRLNRHIERRDRLVRDYQVGVHDYRPRDADTLTLTARKLVRITARVLAHQSDKLEHLVNLFIDDLLVPFALNYQSLRNDFADGHSGVERRYRVLEYHLDLRHELRVLRLVKLILVFGDQLGIAAVRELRFIFLFDLGDQLVRIFAVTVITVVFGALYVLLVFGDYTVKLIFEPFLFAFVSSGFDFFRIFVLRVLDSLFV